MQDVTSSADDSQTTPPPSPATHDIPRFLALLEQLRLAIPPPDSPPSAFTSTKPLLLLHALRPLHRSIHVQLDERRAYLQRLYRRGVDGLNIERASWQYEKDWFLREIDRQRQYTSTEKPIDLISETDFRHKCTRMQLTQQANTAVGCWVGSGDALLADRYFGHVYVCVAVSDPNAPTDGNQLHIARLQDELAERKRSVAVHCFTLAVKYAAHHTQ